LKTEEPLFKASLQALLFEALEDKMQVFSVFLQRATEDTNVVEVNCNEFM
jgi:hypothetical protein